MTVDPGVSLTHPMDSADPIAPGIAARTAGRAWLHQALEQSRKRTLALFAAYENALGDKGLSVPMSNQVNPPVWELGHIGWFQDWWIARNQQRGSGTSCEPDHARTLSRLSRADSLYDSSNVPHDTRWSLPLPDPNATRAYLRSALDETLTLLARTPESADELYFFRLVLLHEDMHSEAAVYMAQALDVPLEPALAFPSLDSSATPTSLHAQKSAGDALSMPATRWELGARADKSAFNFDNELEARDTLLDAFEIDVAPVTWRRYLPYVEAGCAPPPRYLRRQGGVWKARHLGAWRDLNLDASVVHVTLAEAQGWCAWAKRRLPTEAEWELAAMTRPEFAWGSAWEWTATPFAPYPGFAPHPYRDYSAPWFHTRQVLRGACAATHPRMVNPKYRNFFTPERNDIFSGFRSVAA